MPAGNELHTQLSLARYRVRFTDVAEYPAIVLREDTQSFADEITQLFTKYKLRLPASLERFVRTSVQSVVKTDEGAPGRVPELNAAVAVDDDKALISLSGFAGLAATTLEVQVRSREVQLRSSTIGGGAALGKGKGRGKGRGRGRGKGRGRPDAFEVDGNDLPSWYEVRALHRSGLGFRDRLLGHLWENVAIQPPPGPKESLEETEPLLDLQDQLQTDPIRRAEIERQATSEISDYTAPLGIDTQGGFEATRSLIISILELTEAIGLIYKDRFNRPRPNQIEPRIRPALPVPSHSSYVSNHSFQSFSVAEIFQRMLPEHPGITALYHRARRVAENREWAGLHYASDTEAGKELAARVAPYLVDAMDEAIHQALLEWR